MSLNGPQRNPEHPQENKKLRPLALRILPTIIWLILIGLLATWFWEQLMGGAESAAISYSDFREQLQAGNVTEVIVSGEEIKGNLRNAVKFPTGEDDKVAEFSTFTTYLPSFGDDGLLPLLEAQNVTLETEPASDFSFLAILVNFLPFIFLIGIVYLFMRRAQSQGQSIFSMGNNRARLYDQTQERTTFDQVAGLKGAKRELEEIVLYLKNPEKVMRLGGTAPKGVLLVGPPGTGKTLLARAVAGEANVPFFNITGSDFMEMFVGVGASRVRGLFKDARRAAPCIIFIDELDSIGRRRGAGLGGGHDEREQTLNQLLSEMDGFEPSENIVVMAATNRPDILDPALLRPGRFDRRITVDLPTLDARKQILRIHAQNKPMAEGVDLGRLAQGTPGFSGADLENILNESALLAARQNKSKIEWEDIEEARDKVLMGLIREGLALTDEEIHIIAYHEGGHAVVAAVLPNADPIHKVTIVPRGRAMGVTQQLPEKEKYIYPREYLMDRMAVMMGGRAAEDIIFDTYTSGAENDLKQATQLARKMVLDWGMSEKLGHVALGGERDQVFLGEEIAHRRNYSETTAREVDEEIRRILGAAYKRATEVLRQYRKELDAVADALLSKEEITGEEVLQLIHPEQIASAGLVG
ncbi:MAG: ATP-dependent zinc metalloprotease FtsH [Candidatus Promineifilaceae bacterium]